MADGRPDEDVGAPEGGGAEGVRGVERGGVAACIGCRERDRLERFSQSVVRFGRVLWAAGQHRFEDACRVDQPVRADADSGDGYEVRETAERYLAWLAGECSKILLFLAEVEAVFGGASMEVIQEVYAAGRRARLLAPRPEEDVGGEDVQEGGADGGGDGDGRVAESGGIGEALRDGGE